MLTDGRKIGRLYHTLLQAGVIKICKRLQGRSYTCMKRFYVPETVLKFILQKDKKSEQVLFNANYLLVLINFHHGKMYASANMP